MYYKTQNNQLYFLDSAEFEHMLPAGCVAISDADAQIIIQAAEAAAQAVYVPQVISPRQIRMALTDMNLRTQVESAVAAGDQHLKDWYEFSTAFERNHPQVLAMAAVLNVSDADLDALWKLGATL